jgi:hypothetical protein
MEAHTITSANGVRFLDLAESSDHIFYSVHNKEYQRGMADLYCYDVEADQSRQIASAALSYFFKTSTDGTKLLYFEGADLKEAIGTLKMYDVEEDASKEIATGVVLQSVTSHFQNGTVDPDSFFYVTKDYAGDLDIHYYDGKRFNVIVSGLAQ